MLYNFKQFINEENKYKKVKYPIQIILRGVIGLTGKSEDFTKSLMKKIYAKYLRVVFVKGKGSYNDDKRIPKERANEIDYNLPILNFTSKDHKFLNSDDSIVYNNINNIELSSSKIKFQNRIYWTNWIYG